MNKTTSEYRAGKWTAPRPFISLIEQAALETDVRVRWLSDDWIARLERNGKIRYIHGTCFPLNDSGASHVAADKVSTSAVLADARVPVVPHHLVRFPSSGDRHGVADIALGLVKPPLVVKPTAEAGGLDVYKADSTAQARGIIERLAGRYAALAIAPWETVLKEHRVVVLDDVPRLFYEKKLLNQPEWRHNLKHGAVPVLEDSLGTTADLAEMAIRAMQVIGGRFMSVDIIRTPGGLKVLEINSGVMLDRFAAQSEDYRAKAVQIYRDAIISCFD